MKKKVVIVSGYFNPIHRGHIEYFNMAKLKGDKLFVIVNNDLQRQLKGSKQFMLQEERKLIVENIKSVDKVFLSIDKDKTVRKTIEKISNQFSAEYLLYFANGGDQDNLSIPESDICQKLGIKMIDGLGDKVQSSSWILNNKNEN